MLRPVKLLAIAATVLAVALTGPSHAATLIGDSINAEYDYPTTGTVYSSSTVSVDPFQVGAGEESVISIEGVTFLHIDFSASSLIITLDTTLADPIWNSVSQNGPAFSILSGNAFPAIYSVVSSNAGPISAFLSSGTLFVNWAGMQYHNGDIVTVTFASGDAARVSAVTPLPSTWMMLLSGFAGFGFFAYRGTKKNAAALAAV